MITSVRVRRKVKVIKLRAKDPSIFPGPIRSPRIVNEEYRKIFMVITVHQ